MDIYTAAKNGNNNRIIKLLDKGADINAKINGFTPLMFAVDSSLETVKLLLDRGADINAKENDGWTSLMFAVRYSNVNSSLNIVKLLLDRGANINAKNNVENTPLMLAVYFSNTDSSLETVKLLLDRGADINAKTISNQTSLMMAVNNSNTNSSLETVKLLLDRGADINAKDNNNQTALMFATIFSNTTSSLETVKLLLDRGADPLDISKEKKSALDYCPTKECEKLLSVYIWNKLYARDKEMSRKYAANTTIPKDVWEIILLNKRQQQLCKDLNNEKNRGVLELFAIEYGIPITNNMSKAKLCGLISRQLIYGKKYGGESEKYMENKKREILKIAKQLGLDTTKSIKNIMHDISLIIE